MRHTAQPAWQFQGRMEGFLGTQLLVFGPGYSAQPILQKAKGAGWSLFATYRDAKKRALLEQAGIHAVAFDAQGVGAIDPSKPLHILVSIAPLAKSPEMTEGDPVLHLWKSWLSQQTNILSISYLSSTNTYGDHDGAWVDETTQPNPTLDRGKRRLVAEKAWENLAKSIETRLFIFRLAGIYGPDRNAFCALKAGRGRCIIKKNQVFSRIHQTDICATVWAAMNSSHKGGIFNLADDMPTPPHEVIETAAAMMNIAPPKREAWKTAELSEMARSFYLESKRVRNEKIKKELGVNLVYPTYKQGLEALFPADGI